MQAAMAYKTIHRYTSSSQSTFNQIMNSPGSLSKPILTIVSDTQAARQAKKDFHATRYRSGMKTLPSNLVITLRELKPWWNSFAGPMKYVGHYVDAVVVLPDLDMLLMQFQDLSGVKHLSSEAALQYYLENSLEIHAISSAQGRPGKLIDAKLSELANIAKVPRLEVSVSN